MDHSMELEIGIIIYVLCGEAALLAFLI